MYGKELIVDLHGCERLPITRKWLSEFFIALCDLIDMEREDLHFWDYEGDRAGYDAAPDHLKGISAVQFIKTSNVTIHTVDKLGKVFLNIFSCKDFETQKVLDFCTFRFNSHGLKFTEVDRL